MQDISEIVVNSAMNRGRGLSGVNSYERELRRFDIAAFLRQRVETGKDRPVRWLDACCGEGRALGEAARLWSGAVWVQQVEIIGVDLYDDLPPSSTSAEGPALRFLAGDVMECLPDGPLDLVTCIHGLHYLPDKLGFLERVYPRLAPNGGLLLAHLDTDNLRREDSEEALWPALRRVVRRQGVSMTLTNYLLRLERSPGSPDALSFEVTFVSRSVSERPNYSGMIAVDSWYRLD